MIAFVEANAPFFTWTGAVFVAAVAIGLVLWAVWGVWLLITDAAKAAWRKYGH